MGTKAVGGEQDVSCRLHDSRTGRRTPEVEERQSPGPRRRHARDALSHGSKGQKRPSETVQPVVAQRDDTAHLAVVVPILKKGKKASDLASYRPISLTSTISKTMERMVNGRLYHYMEDSGLLDENQAGFRRHRSTVD